MSAVETVHVRSGVVRGRRVLIEADGQLAGRAPLLLETVALSEGGESRATTPFTVDHREAWADLPPGLITSVGVRSEDGADVTFGAAYHVDKLFPQGREQLSTHLFHRRTRIADEETLCFMLEQVLASASHGPVEKFEAVKILSYRALESLSPDRLRAVYDLGNKGLQLADELPHEFGVPNGVRFQESRHQAKVSSRQFLWYAALLLGEFDRAEQEAIWLLDAVPLATRCPTAAYNSSITLLAYGQVLRVAGLRQHADKAFDGVIALFRAAAAGMPAQPPATFVEIAVSFEAAKAASAAARFMRGKAAAGFEDLTWPRLAKDFCRLRTDPSRQAFARALEDFAAFKREGAGSVPRTGADG